uniref:Bestrophin homolog n=1 Tax=Meloidogyne hapla TaxID=6305 RepID=A0A1I8BPS4_MELHA
MANSQATYTVFESDCPMLSDLELSESSLLRLDEEDDDDDRTAILGWILNENGYPRTFRPDESVILDGPSFGMDLPVITSPEPEEDMAETPMAETKNFSNGLIKLENKQNRSHLMLEGLEQQKRGNKEENKSPNMIADGKIDNACYLRTNVSNVSRNVQNPQREKETASKCREEKTRASLMLFCVFMST